MTKNGCSYFEQKTWRFLPSAAPLLPAELPPPAREQQGQLFPVQAESRTQARSFVGVPIAYMQEGREKVAITKDYATCSLSLLPE